MHVETPSEAERWRVVENVVAAIQRALVAGEGWQVTQNAYVKKRGSRRRRQVDVLIEDTRGGSRIGIDIKAGRRPLDIEVVEQLCYKLRKLELDRSVIISTSGFTKTAEEEANEEGVLAVRLEELSVSDILQVPYLTLSIPDLDVEIEFRSGVPRPSRELLASARIATGSNVVLLQDLARKHVMSSTRWKQDQKEGVVLVVHGEPPSWRSLIAGDKEYAPPAAMRIRWTRRTQEVLGKKFRFAGREAFTAVVPGEEQQFTLVTDPNPEGGFRVVVVAGDLVPARRNV